MARLVVYPGTPQAREFELKPGTNYVGRGFANDFTIEDGSVSSSHAQIVIDGESVQIKDLGSTNGTYLNSQPVTEAVLQSGQRLRLGGVEMLFENLPSTTVATVIPPVRAANPPAVKVNVATPTSGGTAILTPQAIELPPPPSTAPVVPAMMELPEGKSACKSHQKSPAQWFCQKCRTAFCSLCVTNRQAGEMTGHFCRTCGVQCVPVKIKYVVTQEKKPVVYSDVMVLVRSIGFGFGSAVLAGVIWALVATIMVSLHMRAVYIFLGPPLLCWGTGALSGLAVKIACQDRPGIVFSLIACAFCLFGISFGGVGVAMAVVRAFNPLPAYGIWPFALFGTVAGLFSAWKIGGGNF